MIRFVIAAACMAMLAGEAAALAMEQPQGGDRLICRRLQQTGTRQAAPRVCRTASQWREMESGRDRDSDGRTFLTEETIAQPQSAASAAAPGDSPQ